MKNSINKSCWIASIFLLAVSCSSPKHTIMSVARIAPVASIPITTLQDTTRYTAVLPKQSPQKIINPKDNFEQSYQALKEMLQGTAEPDFEKAVFLSENPYYNNRYTYSQFQGKIDAQLYLIRNVIIANDRSDTMDFNAYVGTNGKFKMADIRFLPKEKKELYRKALTNWAIFKFLTDTITTYAKVENLGTLIYRHTPFTYATKDPFGKNDWRNTQVINMLMSDVPQGNCFALAAIFKILANRENSDAKICTAPQHIYIQHRDTKGDYYNVELATAGYPRDGTLQTLTHTTTDGIMSGIALRDYTEQQSIGLCLVNLAKSYEHYFETKDDEFLLRCAETVLQYDSLNLNALLLKQQVLDNRVVNYARQSNNQSIFKLKQDKNIQQTVADLEQHTALLYRLGYRQMPLDMQQIILSGNYPDSGFVDKNPSPFTTIDPKDAKTAKYHSLYGGLFQEVFDTKPTETYGHFVYDTKAKQLKTIDLKAQENDLIDPVAFAYDFGARMYDSRLGRFTSTDPLGGKFPFQSPYVFAANNVISKIDLNGLKAWDPKNAKLDVMSLNDFSTIVKNEIIPLAKTNHADLQFDCNDLALFVIMKYFETKEVEFSVNIEGDTYSSNSDKYNNFNQFFEDVRLQMGSKYTKSDLSFEIKPEQVVAGDMYISDVHTFVLLGASNKDPNSQTTVYASGYYYGKKNINTKVNPYLATDDGLPISDKSTKNTVARWIMLQDVPMDAPQKNERVEIEPIIVTPKTVKLTVE